MPLAALAMGAWAGVPVCADEETAGAPAAARAAVPPGASSADLIRAAIRTGYPATVDIMGLNRTAEGADQGYAGSGVIVHESGFILTNNHVVGEGRLTAHLSDGTALPCRVVARHGWEDIAIVKVDAQRPLPHVRMGRNAELRVGDPAVVIGNPNGLSHTVSTGIVSRLAVGYVDHGHIQTTAAVNGGNSGGPLLSEQGELIGVINAKVGGEAIGLAIPIDRVRRLFPEMMLDETSRGWRLGLEVDPFAPEARVTSVRRGGPAEQAGVRAGDVLVRVAGMAVRDGIDFALLASDRNPGDAIPLEWIRDGAVATATLAPRQLGLRPSLSGDFVYGLAFEVFHGTWSALPDFDRLVPSFRGWTNGFTHKVPGAGADRFGLRFTGFVDVPADGVWTFYTLSDDGSRLWLGDEAVVDNDGSHPPQERRGVIRLRKGKHPIRVHHIEGVGGEHLQVFWSGPGTAKQEIPATALFVRP